MQSLIRAIYPPQCVACGALTEAEFGLCGACWSGAHFIGPAACCLCGLPLVGEIEGDTLCDGCLEVERPWLRGAATCLYADVARDLVLQLKHGDRTDLARPLGDWMARRARDLVTDGTVVVPVPLHRWRLLRRRYNQAAMLAQRIGAVLGLAVVPDALVRVRATAPLRGLGAVQRHERLAEAIRPHPRRARKVAGRAVLLVDDVMTSGATLAACSTALTMAGAAEIRVLVLARVAPDGVDPASGKADRPFPR